MSNLNVGDLIIDNKADDKNFLIWSDVRLPEDNLIELHFSLNDKVLNLNELKQFKKQLDVKWDCLKSLLENNTWLISAWVILLFWDSVNNSKIVLIKREKEAEFDPLHLTMPAWRLDNVLSKCLYVELFEEMLIWNSENYYWFFWEDLKDIKFKNELINLQKNRIKKLWLKEKFFKEITIKDTNFDYQWKDNVFYKVNMYLDSKLIDTVNDLFLFIDNQNKTLEFRKIFLSKKQNCSILADLDWYDRDMFLVDLSELKKLNLDWFIAKSPNFLLKKIKSKQEVWLLVNSLKGFIKTLS